MILRRIANSIRRQDWFTVLIEICIVVIGLLIGLQVNNWNERLNDQERGENYVERLIQEMTINRQALSGRQETYAKQIRDGLFAIEATTNPTNREDAWILVRSFFQASHAFTLTLQRGTYEEIISSGDLSLLNSQELVDALSEFYAFGGFATIAAIPDYRVNVRRFVPFHLQRYFQSQCYEITPPDIHQLLDCPPPDSDDDFIKLASELQADGELKRDLQYMLSYAGVSADIARNRVARADHVLTILAKTLQKE